MNRKNQSPVKKLLGIRGMGAALTASLRLRHFRCPEPRSWRRSKREKACLLRDA